MCTSNFREPEERLEIRGLAGRGEASIQILARGGRGGVPGAFLFRYRIYSMLTVSILSRRLQ